MGKWACILTKRVISLAAFTQSNKIKIRDELYGHLHDKALWSKVIEGDKDALAFIYKTYFNSLYQYGMKLQPDEGLVKDCIHDLFVTIWLSRERLSVTDSIRYYLLASLKRKIASQQQKKLPGHFGENTASVTSSPEEVLIGEQSNLELRAKLGKIMDQLPRRQKEILYLRYYEGLDTKETAAIMDLSVNSTYVLLSKAINYLKKHSDKLIITSFLIFSLFFLK
ncbi:sigma-70 family RNA polymerase sigma factor [Chitinophaga niabensis]|uniref:RNA polymerase sigma factor n=1 Tax=Chitinophaga niabensis TaxID=536979 RepID=UPI0031B9E2C1